MAIDRTRPADISELVNTEAVASLLGVSAMTVRRLVAAGKIPEPIRLGRLIQWRRIDLLALLA